MAGIYIHIPFCKQKCSYCDFHFSTNLKHRKEVFGALVKEILQKKNMLPVGEQIQTIYFGGGTPSLLTEEELQQIMNMLYANYSINEAVEFTFECNPDDLNSQKLKQLQRNGINRLSIGVQSFFDEDLQFFNRAHNQQQAEKSILRSQEVGFDNITIDLIYGTPSLTLQKWEQNLVKFSQLNLQHLSAYTLTVEPKTVLHHLVTTNQTILPTDEETIKQFKMLMEITQEAGLIHYEVSNFGKKGFFSQHNSNYWKGENYLGFGPSAHSYLYSSPLESRERGVSKRSWNVANNTKYIKAINQNLPFSEEEIIDEITAFNEYILTHLRTIWGVDIEYLKTTFSSAINMHFTRELNKYKNSTFLQISKNKLTLTPEGFFLADKITSDLFYV